MKRAAVWCLSFIVILSGLKADGPMNNPFALPPEVNPSVNSEKVERSSSVDVPDVVQEKKEISPNRSVLPPAPVTSKMQPSDESAEARPVYKKVDKATQVSSGIDFKKMEEEDEDVVDTVGAKATSGNWVFKNYWWRKIEDLYTQIKEAFNTVMATRMNFFSQRTEVDKELDRFYQHVGIEQGPLEDIINLGLEVMQKEKKDQGYLNRKEQLFFDKIQNKQQQFEQLKKDVIAIEELDSAIDQALETVLQQVDICNKYEQEAWQSFKNVARELSDKEARKQYYQTKALLADINNVNNYLTGPLSDYFNQMVQSLQEHTQTIVSKLATLKADGIDLQKEIEFFEQEDENFEKEEQAKKEAVLKQKSEEEERKKTEHHHAQKHEQTFFRKTIDYLTQYWDIVTVYWHQMLESLKGLFGGSVKRIKAVEREIKEEEKNEVSEVYGLTDEVAKEIEEK